MFTVLNTTQGDVVYANYGRVQDFAFLAEKGINLTNRIVLARYGYIFRANIVSVTILLCYIG